MTNLEAVPKADEVEKTNTEGSVSVEDIASCDALLARYKDIKYETARVMGFSALGSKEVAYEVANSRH